MSFFGKKDSLVSISRLTASVGKADRLQEVILSTVEAALAAPGNLGFVVHVSKDDPRHFLLFEHWQDQQALDRHMKDAGMLAFFNKTAREQLIAEGPVASHWTEIAGTQ